MIRVLLVDDSPVALRIIKRMLLLSPEIAVVGTAANGREALNLIPQVKPDVICTDLHMPVMDGLQLTGEVMSATPLPILLVSVSAREGSLNAFRVIEAGAVDIFHKPVSSSPLDEERNARELIRKVKIISGVRVFRRPRQRTDFGVKTVKPEESQPHYRPSLSGSRIVVIGASTGGPTALQEILSPMPHDFPLPVVCIQHIAEGFLAGFVEWLSSRCRVKFKIATPDEPPLSGVVYFPREGMHLGIGGDGRFVYSTEPPVAGHRPSITLTMESMARYYGSGVLGILLTGMGRDGADGMKAVALAGGVTIAQDEKSSVVFGMPKEAIRINAADHIMSLDEIAQLFSFFARNREGAPGNER